jgi:hypothetical protein
MTIACLYDLPLPVQKRSGKPRQAAMPVGRRVGAAVQGVPKEGRIATPTALSPCKLFPRGQ